MKRECKYWVLFLVLGIFAILCVSVVSASLLGDIQNWFKKRFSANENNDMTGELFNAPGESLMTSPGLVAYYPFDGNANDASGNGLNGIGNGGIAFNSAGKKAQAAYFDGIDDYISLPSTEELMLRNNITTIGMWVNINKNGPNGYSELYSVTGNTLTGRTGIKISINNGQDSVGMDASGDFYNTYVASNININFNNWYYFTVQIDRNTNKFKVYVNGNYLAEDTFTGYVPTTNLVRIGGNFLTGNTQDWLNGTIDEVKIWNYALSDSDILNEYNSGNVCVPDAVSVTCGTWVCGNKVNNCGQTVSCGTCSGTCNNGVCDSAVEKKLVAYYPFDGNANDASGNNNGVINGATLTTGKKGQAYKFDGINDYIYANSIGSFPNGTIGAWVRCSSNTCTGSFVDAMDFGTNGGDLWLLGFHTYYGTDFRTGIYAPSSWNWAGSQVTPVRDNWYYLTSVWGANGIKIYVNGQLKGTNSYTGAMPAHNKIVFGGSTWRNFVNATIDEVKIWNYELSASDILNEYNSVACVPEPVSVTCGGWVCGDKVNNCGQTVSCGTCSGTCNNGVCVVSQKKLVAHYALEGNINDSSGNGNKGVSSLRVTFSNGKKGLAGNFDRSYIKLPNSNSLNIIGNISASAWIYRKKNTGAMIVHKGGHYSIYVDSLGRISWADSSSWSFSNFGYYGSVPLNSWNHIAVTKSGSNVTIYLNGNIIKSKNFGSALTSDSSIPFIGCNSGSSGATACTTYYFNGSIDEVKIWNYALTKQEVLNEYNSGNVCVPDAISVTCNGWVCGNKVNNCGQTISCGTCGTGLICNTSGQCISNNLNAEITIATTKDNYAVNEQIKLTE